MTMIRPGEVGNVRELMGGAGRRGIHRVQATVVLGSDAEHGTASVTIESASPEVIKALGALHAALRNEAKALMAKQLEGQRAWDTEVEVRRRA